MQYITLQEGGDIYEGESKYCTLFEYFEIAPVSQILDNQTGKISLRYKNA